MFPTMPAQRSRHVVSNELLLRFIDNQVAEGRYAAASELVRAALRLVMEREDVRRGAAAAASKDGPEHG